MPPDRRPPGRPARRRPVPRRGRRPPRRRPPEPLPQRPRPGSRRGCCRPGRTPRARPRTSRAKAPAGSDSTSGDASFPPHRRMGSRPSAQRQAYAGLDTAGVRIAATQTFPGPAWDEMPDVSCSNRGRRRSRCPASTCSPWQSSRSGRRSSSSSPTSGSSRTTASATTSSTSRPAASAGSPSRTRPGVLDAAVADLTLALILACRRHRRHGGPMHPRGRLAEQLGAARAARTRPRGRDARARRPRTDRPGGRHAARRRSAWRSPSTRAPAGSRSTSCSHVRRRLAPRAADGGDAMA